MPKTPTQLATTHAPDATSRRVRDLVASLRAGDMTDVLDTFAQLDALPVNEVRDAFSAWRGPLPDPDQLDAETRRAIGLPPRSLRLRTLSVTNDADVLDLGPVAEAQLRLAGQSWDGRDLPAEDRLDGELEDSFAGTLERRVLADADAPGDVALFDVLLFAEGSGVVFSAGTTTLVALIAYGKVELKDSRSRAALQEAIAPPGTASFVAGAAERSDGEQGAAKATEKPRAARAKTAATRTVSKKPAAKKTAATKAATKTAAKKAATKTAAKKAASKTRPKKKTGTVEAKRARR